MSAIRRFCTPSPRFAESSPLLRPASPPRFARGSTSGLAPRPPGGPSSPRRLEVTPRATLYTTLRLSTLAISPLFRFRCGSDVYAIYPDEEFPFSFFSCEGEQQTAVNVVIYPSLHGERRYVTVGSWQLYVVPVQVRSDPGNLPEGTITTITPYPERFATVTRLLPQQLLAYYRNDAMVVSEVKRHVAMVKERLRKRDEQLALLSRPPSQNRKEKRAVASPKGDSQTSEQTPPKPEVTSEAEGDRKNQETTAKEEENRPGPLPRTYRRFSDEGWRSLLQKDGTIEWSSELLSLTPEELFRLRLSLQRQQALLQQLESDIPLPDRLFDHYLKETEEEVPTDYATSDGERLLKYCLRMTPGVTLRQREWHPTSMKKWYRFDFLCLLHSANGDKEFVVEYDGSQHFMGDTKVLRKQQQRDTYKNLFLLSHNISLLRIPYTHSERLGACLDLFLQRLHPADKQGVYLFIGEIYKTLPDLASPRRSASTPLSPKRPNASLAKERHRIILYSFPDETGLATKERDLEEVVEGLCRSLGFAGVHDYKTRVPVATLQEKVEEFCAMYPTLKAQFHLSTPPPQGYRGVKKMLSNCLYAWNETKLVEGKSKTKVSKATGTLRLEPKEFRGWRGKKVVV